MIFGDGSLFYYILQVATMLILVLASNTAFADFPRLSYFLSRDRFLPRQFAQRGDRLVFSNGVVALGIFAALLVIAFGARSSRCCSCMRSACLCRSRSRSSAWFSAGDD